MREIGKAKGFTEWPKKMLMIREGDCNFVSDILKMRYLNLFARTCDSPEKYAPHA